ncbi:MAG: class I SAM-dependent methyltransferase [Solirubrobacterales bacterium]|nr:class I SAM-dependent methyltransferase [Solirubrobacterales bacterium]MBV9536185.1 class I SAM-dependent methyltransferase [Solirubrobacterales bacterium]
MTQLSAHSSATHSTSPETRSAADGLTEFDSPTFDGAHAERSIAISRFDEAYRARPPWDIDGAQPAFARLLDAGLITGRVLDLGCGTGENALHFASHDLDVTGLDASIVAIDRARTKARRRGVQARFIVGDALRLNELGETFDTITDSGLLHVLSDREIEQLIRGIHAALRPAGRYWLMCFSERATHPGPRKLTKARIARLFQAGWTVHSIHATRFETVAGRGFEENENAAAAWLVAIQRV